MPQELLKDKQIIQPKRSDSQSLFIGLTIALVCISGGGAWAFQWFGAQIKQNTEENLLAIAKLKSNQIEQWLTERKNDAVIFSARPSVKINIEASENLEQLDAGSKAIAATITGSAVITKSQYGYTRIVLLNRQGKTVWNSEVFASLPAAVAIAFQQEIQSASNVVKPELIDLDWVETNKGKKVIYGILYPLYDKSKNDKSKALVGAVYLEADPNNYLFPLLSSWPTSSRSAETLLIRQKDNLVQFISPLRHQNSNVLEFAISLDQTNYLGVQTIKSQVSPFIAQSLDYRGVPVLAATVKVKGTPWIMLAKIDLNEANEPLQRLAIAISSLSALLIGVLLYITYQVKKSGNLALIALEQKAKLEQSEILAENASRYATAIETSIDGYAMIDRDGKFIEVNDSFGAIAGYSTDELLTMTIFDLVVGDDF